MKIQQLTAEQAIKALRSHASGLTQAEAARRYAESGPNIVEPYRGVPLSHRILKELTHFFAILLWIAAALAFWADVHDPGQGMHLLGFAIIAVILINAAFSFWQVLGAEKALQALEQLLPRKARVLRSGAFLECDADQLVPGDIIALEAGDLIPADCRLIEAFGVQVNNATLTGESLPQGRDAKPTAEEDTLHCRNLLLAGTTLVAGEARALVYATGPHSEFGAIAHLARTTGDVSFPLQRELSRLSHVVAVLSCSIGAVCFLIGATAGIPFWANFLFAIGVIVANVPEGLLPTVTLALAIGAQRMARRNVLIRHLAAVETLGSATVICTDKTGTLTLNRMRAHTLLLGSRFLSAEQLAAAPLDHIASACLAVARHCHNLKPAPPGSTSPFLGDPTEIALAELAQQCEPNAPLHTRTDEIPFDSRRKRLSTIHQTPAGRILHAKGALESLLPLCSHLLLEAGPTPLDQSQQQRLLAAQDQLAAQGLRVLALASRTLPADEIRDRWESDLTLIALVGLEDPPRPETTSAIAACRQAGIKVIMITGDHPSTALAIARQIHLVSSDQPTLLTGEQLNHLTNSQLMLELDDPEILFARISSEQKLRIVKALQRKHHIVAVTGDGVNDAPALKQADIGIAMGVVGTDVARQAADIVLTDDHFASIVAAIEEGRAIFDNIRKFLTYILASNVPELVPYLASVLCGIPLPLTIIQILAVDLGTDMIPALALGAEPPEPGVMKRPPRPARQPLLTPGLILRSYLFLGAIEAAIAMLAYFFLLNAAGWHFGQALSPQEPIYRQATTATFAAIVLCQVVNVFLCRSASASVLAQSLLSNKLILLGIASELLLLAFISYHPWGNLIFGTAPLSLKAFLFIAPCVVIMILCEEVRKALVRSRIARKSASPNPP
jgi:calcium-translocating P-type ATPase